MRKIIIFLILLYIFVYAPSASCKAYQAGELLNNKTLSPDRAIKNGSVVIIYSADIISGNPYDDLKVHNISRLDAFIENVNKGKKDKVRIAKYVKGEKQTRVNRLYDLKYDGNKIVDIEYDVYSNPDAFIPFQPLIFHSIIKRDYPDALWYGICLSDKGNEECATLISFDKRSIVDSRAHKKAKGKHIDYGENPGKNDNIAHTIRFAAFDKSSSQSIEGAKLVIINREGDVIDILTTDKNGLAEKKITAVLDKRYYVENSPEPIKRGTVTVIAYKKDYCETVLFEVPVSSADAYQPFSMEPVVSGQRNEPIVQVADSHHLEIVQLAEKYRKYLKSQSIESN